MKPSTVPMFCGIALAAMTAAGVSHWWTVQIVASAVHGGVPLASPAPPAVSPRTPAKSAAPDVLAQAPKHPTPEPETDAAQKKFYEALVRKMDSLQNQNRDLLDQVAETNRDVMKLEFRVDTHSESFRPMPVSEERQEASFEAGPGVLPPRAEPVFLPSGE